MNIKYVVLSCDKNLDSRIQPARKTWISELSSEESYVFLTDELHDSDCFPYNDHRYHEKLNYNNVSLKYVKFFKEYNHTVGTNYFFLDDDTFPIFPTVRQSFVTSDYPSISGFMLQLNYPTIAWGNAVHLPVMYPSGGRGFFMNESCFTAIQGCVRFFQNQSPVSSFTDVTVGMWLKSFGIPVQLFHNTDMMGEPPQDKIDKICKNKTYHRVVGEDFFKIQKRVKNEAVCYYKI